MSSEQKFRTKTGFCHILSDKIILTRNGIIGDVAALSTGNRIYRVLLIYGLISIALLYMAYTKIITEDWVEFALYSGIGIYLLYTVISSVNLSATPVIERSKIIKVEFKASKKFLTRSYFKIQFEHSNGKKKSRLIMLPGSLSDGSNETTKALEIMKNSGLLNSTS